MKRTLVLIVAVAALAACSSSSTATPPTTTVVSPTGRDVIRTIREAGVVAPNERDLTSKSCGSLGCTGLTVTDILSVHEWPDRDAAAHMCSVAVELCTIVGETTTVTYHSGGSVPIYDQAQIEQILRQNWP